jgi:predicted MFS family arabinose efflux permease
MSLGTLVGTLLRRVLDGLRFAMRHPVLRPSFLTFPVMEAVLFSLSFFLPQLLHGRGHSVQTLGVLLTVWTVGRVCGLLAFRSGWLKLRRSLVFRINFVFQGLAVLVIASSGSLVVMGAAFLLLGLPAGAAQVAMSTYLQTEVPRELRAQAFACLSSIVTWCAPLGPVLLGLVGSAFGVTPVFAVIGAVLLAGGVFLASRRSFAQLD